MKQLPLHIAIFCFLVSCKHQDPSIVSSPFVDSVLTNYGTPAALALNTKNLSFWKGRIDPQNPGIVNESRYAGELAARFRLLGDIHDIRSADSLLHRTDSVYNHRESSVYMSLMAHAISQHQFKNAYDYFQQARALGLKPYDSYAAGFDVNFELGKYYSAEQNLKKIQSLNDFGYFFRKSKWEHYEGNLEASILSMNEAYKWAGSDISLQQFALANTADLYLHAGDPAKASVLYMQSIRLNAADMHSLLGLGWIALLHDHNESLANRIFQFVMQKTKFPEPLLKLEQAAELGRDSIRQLEFASQFATIVRDSLYGNMYNKYLIDLYTGILHDPAKAEALANIEIKSRPTPQTYAWLVWSVFSNNRKEEAYKIYEEHVSGQPLEGIELYWMGKFMQAMNKGYNAQAFFKAAEKSRYDLSPNKIKDLESSLEE